MAERTPATLKVKVRGYGQIRERLPEGGEMNLPRGSRVEDLIASLGMAVRDIWLIARNGEIVEPGVKLQDGDEVDFFLPVGGGG